MPVRPLLLAPRSSPLKLHPCRSDEHSKRSGSRRTAILVRSSSKSSSPPSSRSLDADILLLFTSSWSSSVFYGGFLLVRALSLSILFLLCCPDSCSSSSLAGRDSGGLLAQATPYRHLHVRQHRYVGSHIDSPLCGIQLRLARRFEVSTRRVSSSRLVHPVVTRPDVLGPSLQIRSAHYARLHGSFVDVVPSVRQLLLPCPFGFCADVAFSSRYEQGKRASWFLGANGLAMMICPPIAYGLSAITSSTIASWKVRFV